MKQGKGGGPDVYMCSSVFRYAYCKQRVLFLVDFTRRRRRCGYSNEA